MSNLGRDLGWPKDMSGWLEEEERGQIINVARVLTSPQSRWRPVRDLPPGKMDKLADFGRDLPQYHRYLKIRSPNGLELYGTPKALDCS